MPVGYAVKKPAAAGPTIVKLKETACAVVGIPHCPVTGKSRGVEDRREGGPHAPEKP